MGASTIHQSAPGGQGADFRVVHDAEPEFGGSVVLNLITIDLIRGLVGHQHIIGVIPSAEGTSSNMLTAEDCSSLKVRAMTKG